jgi:UDP-glucose 4-epimerase
MTPTMSYHPRIHGIPLYACKPMSIGIVGANGFIGAYLTNYLLRKELCPLRLLVRRALPQWDAAGVELICGDLLSQVDCQRFAADLTTIYYLAHTSSPVNSDRDWPNDTLNNLVPLLNLLQSIRDLKTKPHIVYFSSGGAVYAPRREPVPYTEVDACAPVSSYGIQKLAAEQYLRLAADRGYITSLALRIGNAYGTQLPSHRLQGLIGVAIQNVLHGKPVRVFGSLSNVRDYVHLEDVCTISEMALGPRDAFDVINVGTSIGYSVTEVLHIIEESCGRPMNVEIGGVEDHGLTNWVVLDNSKAKRTFGWAPLIDLRFGVKSMLVGTREGVQLGVGTT